MYGVNLFLNGQDIKRLWHHQVEAVKKIRDHLNKITKPNIALCVLPIGGGKTGIAVLSAYATNKSKVLIITPSVKISEQIYTAFMRNKTKPSFLVQNECVQPDEFFNYRPACMGVLKNTNDIENYFASSLIISNVHKSGPNSRTEIASIPNQVDLVIVYEAHHYPAPTWKHIINHFNTAVKLFITATPKYKDKDISENQQDYMCYQISRATLVERGMLRNLIFPPEYESDSKPYNDPQDTAEDKKHKHKTAVKNACENISNKVKQLVVLHDGQDPRHFHQAMILCQSSLGINPATLFVDIYNKNVNNAREKCYAYTGTTPQHTLNNFLNKDFRTLIIVGRLPEGFDHSNVVLSFKCSVIGIARNVSSQILFTQFVGRALRNIDAGDVVDACIVSDAVCGKDLKIYQMIIIV